MTIELFSQDNLLDDDNLHWMVFKVKQKVQSNYYDKTTSQVGQASSQEFISGIQNASSYHQYNWPYDYFSFIELGSLSTEVLYKVDPTDEISTQRSELFENKLKRMTTDRKYKSIKKADMMKTMNNYNSCTDSDSS